MNHVLDLAALVGKLCEQVNFCILQSAGLNWASAVYHKELAEIAQYVAVGSEGC